jgi:hypothetical protein
MLLNPLGFTYYYLEGFSFYYYIAMQSIIDIVHRLISIDKLTKYADITTEYTPKDVVPLANIFRNIKS